MNSSYSNSFVLTKSHFILGRRCQKALFFDIVHPELAKEPSKLDIKTKSDGIEVGKYARRLYPEGKLIDTKDVEIALKETQDYISQGVLTLFEAAFHFDGVVIRADILTRKSVDSPWNLYEVKATTGQSQAEFDKKDYRHDIAIQVWVLQHSDIMLEGAHLTYLNKEHRHPNEGSLFVSKDFLPEINSLLAEISQKITKLKEILQSKKMPNVSLGPHCESDHDCPFREHCWRDIPKPSIFNIPNCPKRWKYFEQGCIGVHDLSESDFKSSMHLRVLKCYQEDRPFFDKQMAHEILQQWKYPLSYFDIEAIAYPIPRYPSSRPYQNIPFQFSCHIQQNENSELEHYEFLHDENTDSRSAFIQKMLEVIPQSGSIVVYHQTYEISRFKELARDFPQYAQAINNLILRVVDLKKVIMDTVYYPAFMGSFSIKKVAPVLLGDQASYHYLEVGDGIEAMLAYQDMLDLESSILKKEKIRKNLLRYCKQDTLLMTSLHQWLLMQTLFFNLS